MCNSLLTLSQQWQSEDPRTGADADIRDAQRMQAGSRGVAALAALAAGVTKARAMQLDAMSAEQVGEMRAKRIRRAGKQELGKSVADAVGAGVRVGVGSAAEAEREIVRGYEQDAAVAVLTGRNEARSIRLEAGRVRNAAVMDSLAHGFAAADKWRRSKYVKPVGVVSSGADYWPAQDGSEVY